MARKRVEEAKGGCPDWLATYGDLVTLLLCFFVLLFASSTIDAKKFEMIASSLSGSETTLVQNGGTGISDMLGSGIMDLPATNETLTNAKDKYEKLQQESKDKMENLASDFKTYFAENDMSASVSVEYGDNYVTLKLEDNILFDSGQAALKSDEAGELLSKISEMLKAFPDCEIKIEGHTDNVPISTVMFPNNLYLSSARANEVAIYFMDTLGYDPFRIETSGFGDTRPVDTNLTPEGRAKNRRVELKITTKAGGE